jgi:hypothetical protein
MFGTDLVACANIGALRRITLVLPAPPPAKG